MTAQHCAESEKPGEERVLSTGSGCGVRVGVVGPQLPPILQDESNPDDRPTGIDFIFIPLLCPCPKHGHPYLVYYSGHELWVWLLVGQKLSNDFVHDILRWEEII